MAEHVQRLRRLVGGDELLQLPSVSVALRDAGGRVLLARHAEGNVWLLPGGSIEPGETPADAAVREMWEETGLFVRLTRLIGVFGGPHHIVRYHNGDRTSYVTAAFEAEAGSGTLSPDGAELLEARFFAEGETSGLALSPALPDILHAIFHAPYGSWFRPATWTPPPRDV